MSTHHTQPSPPCMPVRTERGCLVRLLVMPLRIRLHISLRLSGLHEVRLMYGHAMPLCIPFSGLFRVKVAPVFIVYKAGWAPEPVCTWWRREKSYLRIGPRRFSPYSVFTHWSVL